MLVDFVPTLAREEALGLEVGASFFMDPVGREVMRTLNASSNQHELTVNFTRTLSEPVGWLPVPKYRNCRYQPRSIHQ
jgi:hypothetical protein